MTRHPCASDAWFEAVEAVAEDLTRRRGHEIRDHYEVVEVYTDVPDHYADERGTFAWHIVSSPGKVRVGRGDLPSPDVRITMDYATVVPLMRTVIGDDDDVRARIAEITAAAQSDGRMSVEMLGAPREDNPLGSALHDGIAAVTA